MMATTIKVLNDGVIRLDAGALFGHVPKVKWQDKVRPDRDNRIPLCLNCLLLQTGGKNILIDTGVGHKETDGLKETFGLVPSRLMKELKDLYLTPRDIDMIILTHLHFDHSGGCTRMDRRGEPVPAFPKATYYVQKACWEEAIHLNGESPLHHRKQDFLPLKDAGCLELLDGDTQLLPGLWVKVTGGHSKGHQVVLINHGGEKIAFLGDLVPTQFHLDTGWVSSYDRYPYEGEEVKRQLLDQAVKDGWLLIFSHGYGCKAGYYVERYGQRLLQPIEI